MTCLGCWLCRIPRSLHPGPIPPQDAIRRRRRRSRPSFSSVLLIPYSRRESILPFPFSLTRGGGGGRSPSLPPFLLPLPLRPPGTKDRGEGRKSLLEAIIARRAERKVSFPYSCSLCNVCLSTTALVLFACFACHSPYKERREKKTVCVLKH